MTLPLIDGALQKRYSGPAILLHWAIALMMIANIALVWTVDYMPEGYVRPWIDAHKSFGITVLGLGILRLLWRYIKTPPELLPAAAWEHRAAHVTHVLLYVMIFAMPLSGWLHDSAWNAAAQFPMKLFYVVPWPRISFITNLDPATKESLHTIFGAIHTWLSYVLYALVAIHIGGALKHQFIDRQPELQRMWPGQSRANDASRP